MHTHAIAFPLGTESCVALVCSHIESTGDFALKPLGIWKSIWHEGLQPHLLNESTKYTTHPLPDHCETRFSQDSHQRLFFSFLFSSFLHRLDALLSAVQSKHLYWPFWSVCTDTVAVSVLSWGLTRKQSERLVRWARLEGLQTEPGPKKGPTISPLLRVFRGYNISLAQQGWNSWSNLFPSFPSIKLSTYVKCVTLFYLYTRLW